MKTIIYQGLNYYPAQFEGVIKMLKMKIKYHDDHRKSFEADLFEAELVKKQAKEKE